MKKWNVLLLTILVSIFYSCKQDKLEFDLKAKRALLTTANERLLNAIKNKNADSVAILFANNGIICPPGESCTKGKIPIKNWYSNAFEYGLVNMEMTDLELSGNEDILIETGKSIVEIRISEEDTLIKQHYKFINIWEKLPNTSYQLKMQMWNEDAGK